MCSLKHPSPSGGTQGTVGPSLGGDGVSELAGPPGDLGPASALRREGRACSEPTGLRARPGSGDSSSSPSPPCQPGNCASPLRARAPPVPSGRIRIPGRRGGDGGLRGPGRSPGSCGSGGTSLRRPAGSALPGRCSARLRDEPGECGTPAPPVQRALMGDLAAAVASVRRGCVTLGGPAPSLGRSAENRRGWRKPLCIPGRSTGLGAGCTLRRRRGLAQLPDQPHNQVQPEAQPLFCDLEQALTGSAPQCPHL